ncbi:MAG: serine--tRNA ligase, partial [Verrucomicrobia bacterium]
MPSYNAAVLDIKLIREQADSVRRRLASRGAGDEAKVDDLLKYDELLRGWKAEIEGLNAQLNKVSKEIGALMAQKKTAEAEEKKLEARRIGDEIAKGKSRIKSLEAGKEGDTISDRFRREKLLQLPNLPHETVPVGKDAQDNRPVRPWGEKSTFSFQPKSHIDLCESLKLVDFARGAKLSGSGFLLFTDWGARLERALIQ